MWASVVILFDLGESWLILCSLSYNPISNNVIYDVITLFIESICFLKHTKIISIYLVVIYFDWFFSLYFLIQYQLS